jgi:glyoxylase-like metal-dependent hydrolase (beta-lactamase superfamily II)
VSAIRYATLPSFPVSGLVAGADTSRRMDISMMVWLVTGAGRMVLVDAGFYRPKFVERWRPQAYIRPSEAVAAACVRPEAVTDIIVTHVHWDHLDGVDLFPSARVWIQRDEYQYYVNDDGSARNRGIDPDNAAALVALRRAGRLELVPGDAREILPGITCYTGGRHTYASQHVGVRIAGGTVVLASDNVYLFENLERNAAIAQTLDPAANLAAQGRMRTIATDPRLIVPGHDPAVFQRFELVAPRVARIR